MKKLLATIAIVLAAFAFANADTPESTPEGSTDLVISKGSKKRPGLQVIHCTYYSNGTLLFATDVEYQTLALIVTHLESGQIWSAVITPDNPTFNIGTLSGTYEIEARTDGNQFFVGSLSI